MTYEPDPDEFMLCAECADKPGSPTLCPACIHNRSVASQLREAKRTLDFPSWADIVALTLKWGERTYSGAGGAIRMEVDLPGGARIEFYRPPPLPPRRAAWRVERKLEGNEEDE